MKSDADMLWPATADEHADLKTLILEIKRKNDRIMQLLIVVIIILVILIILVFIP
jgi:t-SNARE complex subunit (syntaxin)